ncbi:hypothetical protein MLD38_018086 [Melastoma candidum]|uniref:Uncharacterized protein n=1 Tax=Melastoma candidum TaxID=119954 RepID=A0ACB9QSR8_9MYRT|nr:hypothetical protein MLD38_018086 [Melastoma candidum]
MPVLGGDESESSSFGECKFTTHLLPRSPSQAMLNCLCKVLIRKNPPKPPRFDLCLTQKKLLLSFKSEPIRTDPDGSLTARYLVSALGFTQELALSVSRSFPSVDPDKAAKVVALFDQLGFSQTQISRLVVRFPRVLSFKPSKTILPKIEFLRARGASEADIVKIICGCPRFLFRSLDKYIVPTFDLISRCLKSDCQSILSVMQCASFSFFGVASAFTWNLDALRAAGVPDNSIQFLLRNHPNCLWASSAKFDHALERVKSMGCDPSKVKFVVTVHVLTGLAKSTWEKKVSMFRRWGWSEEDTLRAFERYPNCMMLSEKKVADTMEFFVNEMGVEPTYFITQPVILSLSLKNRIVPRCLVIRALISKKLIQRFSPTTALMRSNTYFMEKFVSPYSAEHPSLLLLYQEKLGEVKNF